MELRTLADFVARSWEDLVGRTSGPMKLRFIVQPAAAAFLALRGGFRDARKRRPAYLWACFTDSRRRRELIRSGWKDIGKVFIIAILLDSIYQVFVLHRFHPMQALIVASTLALVPYLMLRGIVNRVRRLWPSGNAPPARKAG